MPLHYGAAFFSARLFPQLIFFLVCVTMFFMDLECLLWLQSLRERSGGAVENIFAIISESTAYLVAVLFLFCVAFNKKKFLHALFCYGMTVTINAFVKITACVYRPWIREPRIYPSKKVIKSATGYSFPSGHTSAVSSCSLGIIFQYKNNVVLAIVFLIFVLVVAFSRNYLGCHTPQDVLFALLESIAGLAAAEFILGYLEKHDEKDAAFFAVATFFYALLFLYIFAKPYPIDKDEAGNILVLPEVMQRDAAFDFSFGLGLVHGWFFEKRLVKFSTDDLNAKKRILRMAVVTLFGLLVNFVIYPQAKIFFDPRLAKFIKGYLFALGGLFIGPLIFTKIERALKW